MAQDETRKPSRNEDRHPDGLPEKRMSELGLGLLFGVIFGFLLQKGGVAKYEVLIGMLLLEDFTVMKVMLPAVVVGMVGIYALHSAGLVKLHIKPTRYGANTLGGILFGIGFGLAAYCPGTGAAALGQGNFDAIAVLLGLMAGSYVFAEASGWLARTVNPWGDRGVLTLDRVLHLKPRVLVPVMATVLVLVLVAIHVFVDPRP
ncbi:MAG: YeeE/YedE thiosulfate transporter family protein [FCB group bacterium]|jgi:uncharacterized membrane protein YedE/YeeE|nr:YeeE/YedE thiosulfate transporter family protein [FCB group bacterium]